MRHLASVLLIPTCASLSAQSYLMHFDGPDATLFLDSIYPENCWQVGAPDKPIFTGAFSEPNALVTDTIAPHASSSLCYAEFTVPVEPWESKGIVLKFRHWLDMGQSQSFGWIELASPFDDTWWRLGHPDEYANTFRQTFYLSNTFTYMLETDSGSVFTGASDGWLEFEAMLDCLLVMDPGPDDRGGGGFYRMRFVFQGDENLDGWDGWMIDNVEVTPYQCTGGFHEYDQATFAAFPNPGDGRITMLLDEKPGTLTEVLFHAMDGRLVHRWQGPYGSGLQLDLSHLPMGTYVGLVRTADRIYGGKIVKLDR